ncbi:MAG: hypothetical protein IH840_14345 [Candidatus Heimdallarchaeota archaeon]|nr:hypothetical protein [Candidatus Heimdallarchaeota archaeon]
MPPSLISIIQPINVTKSQFLIISFLVILSIAFTPVLYYKLHPNYDVQVVDLDEEDYLGNSLDKHAFYIISKFVINDDGTTNLKIGDYIIFNSTFYQDLQIGRISKIINDRGEFSFLTTIDSSSDRGLILQDLDGDSFLEDKIGFEEIVGKVVKTAKFATFILFKIFEIDNLPIIIFFLILSRIHIFAFMDRKLTSSLTFKNVYGKVRNVSITRFVQVTGISLLLFLSLIYPVSIFLLNPRSELDEVSFSKIQTVAYRETAIDPVDGSPTLLISDIHYYIEVEIKIFNARNAFETLNFVIITLWIPSLNVSGYAVWNNLKLINLNSTPKFMIPVFFDTSDPITENSLVEVRMELGMSYLFFDSSDTFEYQFSIRN